MHKRIPGGLLAGLLLAASLPAALVVAQTQSQAPERRPGLSAEARARLLDGRIAMAKTALKLTDAQLPLWAPVEAQIRTTAADRAKRREERRARREERREKREAAGSERAPLTERLDRASERMTRRAERMARRAEEMKAFSAVFKPFYASLSDEQKAVAGVVLRQMRSDRGGRGHRWAMQGPPEGRSRQ
jgi:hypothetical protein